MEEAKRVKNLPPYLFAEIDKMINKAKENGVDVISFGIGDPDQPTPNYIVDSMIEAVQDPSTHSYPSYEGLYEYRDAVTNWYNERFSVDLDPDTEVISLIGSKEGIAHLPFCYINQDDYALVPDPGYPVYNTASLLAGGKVEKLPLKKENNFLVDLDSVDEEILKKAKLLFLNYPNNPTAATANEDFFKEMISYAKKYDFIIAHDSAYSEIYYEDNKPLSFLEVEGARDVGIEFGSLSKSFNMTGWRVGWAVGNEKIIDALGRIKTNIDSGIFEAIQKSAITALNGNGSAIESTCDIYKNRRNKIVDGLNELGWNINKNTATFYIWAEIPDSYSTGEEFSKKVFEETGVFFTPGIGYGDEGNKYVRIALTVNESRIEEALERLKNSNIFKG
ncbi:LL-diaminopimelate aminotransferase [Halanaerobiaceae bacterium Z-7014]|uniref:Aminotransferase n=1 Tax=Halonatronomonas betaini TaxID=2778430 RepID=A0A931AUZ5_9FIRM|nr:LL-diaminopimelate aminotransferase [Halonatronomonas betaini]MBF8436636.1 LL-diaminopimelate aminotransferase [Halonatronomonas betaini]